MAVLTSHLLNGVEGTHAGNVAISLVKISTNGTRSLVFESMSDEGGRFQGEVSVSIDAEYEMVIASGAYFKAADLPRSGAQILDKIVVRFTTPDPDCSYHIPVIMAPNSYSCWWSA